MNRTARTLVTLASLAVLTILAAAPAVAQDCDPNSAAIFDAMQTVAALDAPAAVMNKLSSAMTNLAEGDTDGLVSDLEAFISKVEKESGKTIPPAVADELIAAAEAVIARIIAIDLCPCYDPVGNALFVDIVDGTEPITGCLEDENVCLAFGLPTSLCAGSFGIVASAFGDLSRGAIAFDPLLLHIVPPGPACSTDDGGLFGSITSDEAASCQLLLEEAVAASGVTCTTP